MVDVIGYVVLGLGVSVIAVALVLFTKVRPKAMVASISQAPITNTAIAVDSAEQKISEINQVVPEAQTPITHASELSVKLNEQESDSKVEERQVIRKTRRTRATAGRQARKGRSKTSQDSI
ncbi:MAG: hypothetical protein QXP36_10075 [Conexivisphaerales archaeon]